MVWPQNIQGPPAIPATSQQSQAMQVETLGASFGSRGIFHIKILPTLLDLLEFRTGRLGVSLLIKVLALEVPSSLLHKCQAILRSLSGVATRIALFWQLVVVE